MAMILDLVEGLRWRIIGGMIRDGVGRKYTCKKGMEFGA